jgi:uncharacterized protein
MHYFFFALIGMMTGLLMALFGIGGGAFLIPALDAAFLTVPNSTPPPFQLIVIGSLCTIVIGALPRAIKALRSQAERHIANTLILSALPFIALASIAATQLTGHVLRLGFSATIVLIGLWTLFGKPPYSTSQQEIQKPDLKKLIVIGGISGISSALFGLGGATLLMPLLTMWVGLPVTICIDISILFVSATSIVSLLSLMTAWIGVHGTEGLDYSMILLILILGISAALTQGLAAGKLIKMKDELRQKLLGAYLITLGIWVITQTLS